MKFKFTIESDSEDDGWKRHYKYVHAEEIWDIVSEVREIVRKARKYGEFDEQNEKVAQLLNQLDEALYREWEIEE